MTFEEFLKKKKIDPGQLKTAERDLFQTFESDFNQMGDRSFEYSKKFWFNKLRRAHPLKEEPKPVKTEETSSAIGIQESPKSTESISELSVTANPKPAFKPRFKAQIPSAKIEDNTSGEESPNPVPAFKPRFRAPVPVVKEDEKETEELKPEPAAKPTGFKPRFKASVTPSAVKPESAENKKDRTETSNTLVKEEQTEKTTDKVESKPVEDAVVKPAYKPRFKPSMLKKDPEE